ncbi:MAG: hypothetical protein ACRECP_03150 [Methylocella sp.]
MKLIKASPPLAKSRHARHRGAAALLAMTLALGWSETARGQTPGQIYLTSPSIQGGAQVVLSGFSTRAALSGAGTGVCGPSTIVKQVDGGDNQYFSLMFSKTRISATISSAALFSTTVFFQVDLTGVKVDSITRSNSLATHLTDPRDLTDTITLQARTFKYTYQPITPTGQKLGPPISFGWNCATNQPL